MQSSTLRMMTTADARKATELAIEAHSETGAGGAGGGGEVVSRSTDVDDAVGQATAAAESLLGPVVAATALLVLLAAASTRRRARTAAEAQRSREVLLASGAADGLAETVDWAAALVTLSSLLLSRAPRRNPYP
eukprot:6667155-Prymnesium_polylepis.1